MAYVALYRKYRSQSFDEVMGQEAVTTILRNAIASGRFGHAYLFYGARGCGKTSTARLLARALNCVAQDGPTPDPCGKCRLCVAIRNGVCMDVIEMDAASETGIDDVREKVIENVQYAPGEARYKVYIIDEVHDLSTKAFDALLKTLEEPPAHVVFVLATTEYHKVPITIRSRCQGFQFKRGSLQDLGMAVERVVKAEGYTAEPEAIQAIAYSAEGSWRDALSILEQVLAYSDGHITAETVHRAVGTVGTRELARLTEILSSGSLGDVIDLAGELLDSGTDARQLLVALQGYLGDLTLLASGAKRAVQELGADRVALLQPQAQLFKPEALLNMSAELSAAEREIRLSNQHRWIVTRAIARLQAIGQGVFGAAPDRPGAQAVIERSRSETPAAPKPAPSSATPTVVPKPQIGSTTTPPDADEEREEPETAPAPATKVPDTRQDLPITPAAAKNGSHPQEEVAAPSATPSVDHRFAEEVTLEVIQRAWPRILKIVEQVSKPAIGFLDKAEVHALDGHIIYLKFRESFARDRIQNKGRDLVEKAINRGLKTEGYKIQCILESQAGGGGSSPASGHTPARPSGSAAAPAIGALLDAPPAPVDQPLSRIMDIDVSAAPPPSIQNSAQATDASSPQRGAEPEPPASDGLLAETLNIFGGEVIKSERLT